MKILHIALNMLRQDALCDALASLGEYHEIDWIKYKDTHGVPALRNHIIQVSNEIKPDIVFMQLQTAGIIDPDTARQIPGFRINWTGDVRQPLPDWYVELGKAIDLSLFTNTADVEAMRTEGCKADYLQIGFDQNVYQKADREKDIDIVFMGNHYGNSVYPLSQLRWDMVHRLKEVYGERFQLYGGNWDIPAKYVQHNTKEECDIYQRSRIAINLSHFDLPRYSSDRIHSIMASGTFCLSHRFQDMELEFTPANNVGVWSTIDELLDLIETYLKFPALMDAIAKDGYELVHSRDTWAKRIEQLKTMLPI
jgi:hypothetical protein